MPTVNIIGAGRVGRTFLRLLGPQVQDIASATHNSAERAAEDANYGRASRIDRMRPAEIWLLAVSDSQIAAAARTLAGTNAPASIAIHFSGFHNAEEMFSLREKGWQLASAHPNLSFADAEVASSRFPGTLCGLEGDKVAVAVAQKLLVGLGAETFEISSEGKPLYHAAAVITNNFTTVLQALALETWEAAGVSQDVAQRLNRSLLRSSVENLERMPPAEALTGPAARGDGDVVKAQTLRMAEWQPSASQIYTFLSGMASRLKTTGRIFPHQEPPRK